MNKFFHSLKEFRSSFFPVSFLVFAVCLFLTSFLLGFFFTEPATVKTAEDFEEQKEEISEMLEKAKEEYLALKEDDDLAQPRQKILFFETALRFSLPIWSGDFYFESASIYARILREWEILNTYPTEENTPRRQHLEALDRTLSDILTRKDIDAFLDFYEDFLIEEDNKTQTDAKKEVTEASLRYFSTRDGSLQPAESALIYQIRLLDESLEQNRDLYHPYREGKSLSENSRESLKALKNAHLEMLQNQTFDPVPANSETLFFAERVLFSLALVFVLFLISRKEPILAKKSCATSVLFPFFSLLLLSFVASFGLLVSTFLFAPKTLVSYPILILKKVVFVPFLPALCLRLSCRVFACLPLILLGLILLERQKKLHSSFFLSATVTAIYFALSFGARILFPQSSVQQFLPFVHLDLLSAFLPSYPPYLPHSETPFLSLLIYLVFSGILFFLFSRSAEKKRRIQN